MKHAYAEACKRGITFSMLPAEYGGGGLSNVDFVIAARRFRPSTLDSAPPRW